MEKQLPTSVPLLRKIVLPESISAKILCMVMKSGGAITIPIGDPPTQVEIWGITEDKPNIFSGFTSSVQNFAHAVMINFEGNTGTIIIVPLEDGGL